MADDSPFIWHSYMAVESVDECAKRALALGGSVLVPPHDVPDVGRCLALSRIVRQHKMASEKHSISQLVWRDGAESQRAFAEAAHTFVAPSERVSSEVTDEGLMVRGVWELDLEVAISEIQKRFTGVKCGKPQIAYVMGPPLLEPFYRITVRAPVENWH